METIPSETLAEVMETIAETLPQIVEATEPVTEVVQASEVVPYLKAILECQQYLFGFGLFLVVVLLCYFSYKFLRIFSERRIRNGSYCYYAG